MLITNIEEKRENMRKIKIPWETFPRGLVGRQCFSFLFLVLDVLKC